MQNKQKPSAKRLTETFIEAFSQYEKDIRSERIKDGIRKRKLRKQ